MSEESQVSKVTLCVKILKWWSLSQSLTKVRYRAARAAKKQKNLFYTCQENNAEADNEDATEMEMLQIRGGTPRASTVIQFHKEANDLLEARHGVESDDQIDFSV